MKLYNEAVIGAAEEVARRPARFFQHPWRGRGDGVRRRWWRQELFRSGYGEGVSAQ